MQSSDTAHIRRLAAGWMIRAWAELNGGGEKISQPDFDTSGWYGTSVPSTVLAALVKNGVYTDPYFGMNLKNIPRQPFEKPWWYRTEFGLSKAESEKTVLLEFDGINYAANIWLNGKQIAGSQQTEGCFRRFQYDISKYVTCGKNALAVEVTPPKPGDFSIGFVDWNPPPPDRNMGVFRPVRLRFCDGVSIESPFVQTELNAKSLKEATLTIRVELVNHREKPVSGVVRGEIEKRGFQKAVVLEARQRRTVEFTANECAELRIEDPKLWWPHNLGRPNLYQLCLQFIVDGRACDVASVRFGIRKVQDYVNEQGHKGFEINGRKVLIKAGGWTDDLLLADTRQSIEAQLRYVKHMNLNSIRLEGMWGSDDTLYDLCDEYGILLMVGWSCQWEHEEYLGKPVDERYGGVLSADEIELVSEYWRDQVTWLRNHPCIYVWMFASDKVPRPELERRYVDTLEAHDPTRPYLASAGGVGSEQGIIGSEPVVSEISGCSGVKMLGPYAYTPPVYWYVDKSRGGAFGFNTETCPGAVVPPLESIKKMIPQDHLWPVDEWWEFHCGLNEFTTLDRYQEAINRRYGEPNGVEEFAKKAQVLNYELARPMFEAFRVRRPVATGIVQWMLNAAWPKMYWQLYDKFLMPTGAFYATRKACEPLQLVYNYADQGVYAVSDLPAAHKDLKATVRVFDIHSREVLTEAKDVAVAADSSAKVFSLGELDDISTTYFLDLTLHAPDGAQVANNFYWLSRKPDVLDFDAKVQPWPYYTPSRRYADFTQLNSMPPVHIDARAQFRTVADEANVLVELKNVSNHIAFFIELNVSGARSGRTILPVFWLDNYVSLLPGQTRTIDATFPITDEKPILTIRGWNLEHALAFAQDGSRAAAG